MNEKQLVEIEARANAAAPGRWYTGDKVSEYFNRQDICIKEIPMIIFSGNSNFDLVNEAEFVAHAREDIPALIAEVRRLRAVVGEYADRKNWIQRSRKGVYFDAWAGDKRGCSRAEECLRGEGE